MTALDLCQALSKIRYRHQNERDLQQGVGQALANMGVEFKAEYRLTPKDRIDFLVGKIGIECKTEDSSGGTTLASVTRQLHRYAQSEEVEELILMTTQNKHRGVPNQMNGKPLFVLHVTGFM